MGREIVTKVDVTRIGQQLTQAMGAGAGALAAAPGVQEDKYKDRLLKYIPADVVAVYLTLRTLVETVSQPAPTQVLYWVLFGIMLVITIPWQRRVAKIAKWDQVWVGTGAFFFWAVSLGNPFTAQGLGAWYQPVFGVMALVLYTFLIPLFVPEPK
jgi:hypothetical protein